MSNNVAIRIEGLGKRYRLGQTVDLKRTFRETLMDLPRFFGHKAARALKDAARRTLSAARLQELQSAVRDHRTADPETPPGTFWALRDINLEVEHGEVVGIIGRNGAGKSTLLKILSRVTDPTTGHAEIRGRVASLLEVGTGFNPELTGRENIYLNGSIMGMKKAEIDRKFDEIVAFAEVEKFLDTPVKRYSSGMSVRLAFAVAAHLEPEILIVDEVLAVGDAAFQRKCLRKMDSVADSGRTILFVSHNMGVMRQLCPSCVWLDQGRIRDTGSSAHVVDKYIRESDSSSGRAHCSFDPDPDKDFQLLAIRLLDRDGQVTANFDCDFAIQIEMNVVARRHVPQLYAYLSISRTDGTTVMVSDSYDTCPNPLENVDEGPHTMRVSIPARTLGPGDYSVYLNFSSPAGRKGTHVDTPGTVCAFHIDDVSSHRGNERYGFFSTLLHWSIE